MREGDFPYMVIAGSPATPSPAVARPPCAAAPEGEGPRLLRPQSRAELLHWAGTLAGDASARCLVLAAPPLPEACRPTPEELRGWAAEAERRFGRPAALCAAGRYPCGETPCCARHAAALRREASQRLEGMAFRADSLAAALRAAFPGLKEAKVSLLHAWAHLSEPGRVPEHPVLQQTLARRFRRSVRWVQRALQEAEEADPALFARLKRIRERRLRRTGAWEVRD